MLRLSSTGKWHMRCLEQEKPAASDGITDHCDMTEKNVERDVKPPNIQTKLHLILFKNHFNCI